MKDGFTFHFSFDGIVLVTQNHDTLPAELECLKAPLEDYGAVSHPHVKYTNHSAFFPPCYQVKSPVVLLLLGGQWSGRRCGGPEGPWSPWKPHGVCLHWPCKP